MNEEILFILGTSNGQFLVSGQISLAEDKVKFHNFIFSFYNIVLEHCLCTFDGVVFLSLFPIVQRCYNGYYCASKLTFKQSYSNI